MADSKTTKKAAATDAPTLEQLRETLATKRQDLLQAKRSNAAGELVNPRAITSTRKEIARISTAIRSQELQHEQKESN